MSKKKMHATMGAVNAELFRQLTARRLAERVAELEGHERGTEGFCKARVNAIDAAETLALDDYAGLVERDAIVITLARED